MTALISHCRRLTLHMMRGVHTLMKNANDRDAVRRDAEVNHMPPNVAAAVSLANVVTGGRSATRPAKSRL
jgi:hypothetical protein